MIHKQRTTFIYGLCLLDDSEIRYVGKSDDPIKRLQEHIRATKNKYRPTVTYKDNWLIKHNFMVEIKILEECDYKIWKEREIYHMSKYDNLVNTAPGGNGGHGILYNISYDECKSIIHKLNIKSKNDWFKLLNEGIIPDNIPNCPDKLYKKRGEWISWMDFLGTKNKFDNLVDYVDYEFGKELLKPFNFINSDAYKKYHKDVGFDFSVPYKPDRYYKNRNWESWADYLSNGKIANKFKHLYT